MQIAHGLSLAANLAWCDKNRERLARSIEERFLHCESRLPRASEAEEKASALSGRITGLGFLVSQLPRSIEKTENRNNRNTKQCWLCENRFLREL
jgi:hypothetical protein